ncbi:MAG TPA: lipocalin-like domain-containing protein [Bryobacteraceae bacterium]|jgi:predicted secreted hydrolase
MRSSNFVLLALLLAVNAPGAEDRYRLALPDYHFEFPRDHFNHPNFQTEWWYYTGNLRTAEGRRFGFELTFFRQGVDREGGDREKPPENIWDVRDIWMAHLALSDIQGRQFLHTERLNRTGPGIAGAELSQARVWNGNWSSQWTFDPTLAAGGTQKLVAVADRFSFDLSLKSEKPPAINGTNGVSQKAEGEGKASHYLSLTRLDSTGTILLDGKRFSVEGSSWMDHEFFTHQLEPGQKGWDWFSLQLEDRSELMLYRLRRADGTPDPYSAGTYIDPGGRTRHLTAGDFTLTPATTWMSPATGGRYPVEWTIDVPSIGFKAAVRTPLAQQEITSSGGSGNTYWEGAIDIDATRLNRPLRGVGYLEMTGYAGRIVGLD